MRFVRFSILVLGVLLIANVMTASAVTIDLFSLMDKSGDGIIYLGDNTTSGTLTGPDYGSYPVSEIFTLTQAPETGGQFSVDIQWSGRDTGGTNFMLNSAGPYILDTYSATKTFNGSNDDLIFGSNTLTFNLGHVGGSWGYEDMNIQAFSLNYNTASQQAPSPVPEPSTFLLLGGGLVGLGFYARKRKKA